LQKNETWAFVGESGSGKTTLVNMIAGLLSPSQGEMWINNFDRKDLKFSDLRKRIGYITQEPVIFNDSIFNNVTFWAEPTEENLARFWQALAMASIDEFVKQLPGDKDSMLGDNGLLISGGQKQRISIARELYKQVEMLILDEATSALDSETERAIQTNIDALKGQYTILMVAHRLSTVRNADVIVMMDKGLVVDMGTFEELQVRNVRFRKMVELQEF
jgi:subfamily B ATP-binding cassette protein MsbA